MNDNYTNDQSINSSDDQPVTSSELTDDIVTRVKRIVVKNLSVDESKIVSHAKFVEDLGADSLDTVELVMAFEEEFAIEIPDDKAEEIQTVKDAIDFIEQELRVDKA